MIDRHDHAPQVPARSRFGREMLLPLFLSLTLAACLNALQLYAAQDPTLNARLDFWSILGARLIYSWYFLILAAVLQRITGVIAFSRQTLGRWLALHCAVLIASFLIHEALMTGVERLFFGPAFIPPIVFRLFNNPSVWIELFVYVLLLLFFSLVEYRRISRDNELAIAQLESQLTKTKLSELRSQIQPAFLFSTLETMLNLVRAGRNSDANHILALLSDFLRTTVYDVIPAGASASQPSDVFDRFSEIEALRSRQLRYVRTEIERIVHEDQNPHHR